MGIQRGNFAGAVFWAAIWKNHGAMVAKANLCLENAWVKSSHEIFGWNHLVIKQKPEVGKFHKLHWLVMLFGICKLIKVWMSWFLCLSAHFFTISTRICSPARPPFFELAKWLDPHCTSSFTHFHNLTQHLSGNKRADRVAMQCIQRLCSVLMYRCLGSFHLRVWMRIPNTTKFITEPHHWNRMKQVHFASFGWLNLYQAGSMLSSPLHLDSDVVGIRVRELVRKMNLQNCERSGKCLEDPWPRSLVKEHLLQLLVLRRHLHS